MIRLEMKNYDMILIETQLKYQLDHQAKFIIRNILLVKISTVTNRASQIDLFSYRKAFEKQIKPTEDQLEKQVDALKNLKLKKQAKVTHINGMMIIPLLTKKFTMKYQKKK